MNANVSLDIQEKLVAIVSPYQDASMEFARSLLSVDACQVGLVFSAKLVCETFNI